MGKTANPIKERSRLNGSAAPQGDTNLLVRRLVWSALTLVTSALAALLARKASEALWQRVFNEEPPE